MLNIKEEKYVEWIEEGVFSYATKSKIWRNVRDIFSAVSYLYTRIIRYSKVRIIIH